MSASELFNIFIFASFIGWIYECIYCTVKTTRWQNRGFLFGPICPIYGLGFIGGTALIRLPAISGAGTGGGVSLPLLFLVCAAGSAVLEYSTSFLLEKLFHARWWDYSHIPLNINGRICLPATLGFGAAGTVILGFLLPYLKTSIPAPAVTIPVNVQEFLSLLLMCMFGADLALSVSSVTRLLDTLEKIEAGFDEKMEARYDPIGKTQRAIAGKITDAGHAVADRLEIPARLEAAGDKKDALLAQVKGLTNLQINSLMNIEVFSSVKHANLAGKIKELLNLRGKTEAVNINEQEEQAKPEDPANGQGKEKD